ncbi:MAG: MmgE/PrpD family protein [Methanobacterium sp.]|nr:MmgE/PrpD family protein [Methanobacterium sp.]
MLTSKLADYIRSTSYDNLPESVITKTKDCLIDFMSVTLKGTKTKSAEAIKSIIKTGDESTVISHGKTSALDAGLANGIFAHSIDLDDGHRLAQIHPGASVIPAALALCESRNKTGKELIESIVVGYQVAIILGMMVNPEHRNRGFHTTGTCGALGAAAAACKALDLNQEQIINALGLAGTQAAGLLESDHSGSMGKHLHAGKAAQSGVLSALLAKKGFTGANSILEGDEGFFKVMSAVGPAGANGINQALKNEIDPTETDLDILLKDYKILEVYFKIYPICRHLHSSIDALLELVKENQINPGKIREITVSTYKIAAEHDNYNPTSTEALRQSLPVSMAFALLNEYNGLNTIDDFNYHPEDIEFNKKIINLSQKIIIKEDLNLNKKYPLNRPSRVSIQTLNDLYEKTIDLPYGEPENPLNKSDLYQKFRNLNPKVDTEVLHITENIETFTNINHFIDEINQF